MIKLERYSAYLFLVVGNLADKQEKISIAPESYLFFEQKNPF